MHLDNKRKLILCSPHLYQLFSYSFRPRGESATFLLAAMHDTHLGQNGGVYSIKPYTHMVHLIVNNQHTVEHRRLKND